MTAYHDAVLNSAKVHITYDLREVQPIRDSIGSTKTTVAQFCSVAGPS
jgi:hypothetical protein